MRKTPKIRETSLGSNLASNNAGNQPPQQTCGLTRTGALGRAPHDNTCQCSRAFRGGPRWNKGGNPRPTSDPRLRARQTPFGRIPRSGCHEFLPSVGGIPAVQHLPKHQVRVVGAFIVGGDENPRLDGASSGQSASAEGFARWSDSGSVFWVSNLWERHVPCGAARSSVCGDDAVVLAAINRDRGASCDATPPTPPCIRVRTRRFGGLSGGKGRHGDESVLGERLVAQRAVEG